ncbi:MAG TPA: methylamine utilization protein, partial [Aquabacterium sp.]|nr:methylamine utilization protein [Aquabacterium sp.]
TKPFEIKLYTGRPSAPVTFDKPGTATLGCNIHDNMLGHIHVVDTPYFGVTNGQGKVDIDVPGGDHRVRVWHPKMGENMAGQDFRMVLGSGPLHLRLLP